MTPASASCPLAAERFVSFDNGRTQIARTELPKVGHPQPSFMRVQCATAADGDTDQTGVAVTVDANGDVLFASSLKQLPERSIL